MKQILYLILCFSLNSKAQNEYFIEYNVSNVFFPKKHIILDNTFSLGFIKNQMLFSVGVGREDWFINYYDHDKNSQFFNYRCVTYKVSPMLERRFKIPRTRFSCRIGLRGKFFCMNQIKDSLSYQVDYNLFSTLKPGVITKFNPNSSYNMVNGYKYGSKNEFYYITSVPYAITANFAIQYAFKKWAIKLQYEPTFIRVKTRNAANSNLKSSVFFFYNNIGIGVNYPLNFNKKDQKVTGLE